MTREEAIETIRILLSRAEELDGPNLLLDEEEALEMGIEAINKQIPADPITIEGQRCCAICGKVLKPYERYCFICGQLAK